MDVDEVRRKRIKLFDHQSTRHGEGEGEASCSSTAVNFSTAGNDTISATLPQPQHLSLPRHQAGCPPNMEPWGSHPNTPSISDDEKYARQLQAEIAHDEHLHSQHAQELYDVPPHILRLIEDDKRMNEGQQQYYSNGYPHINDYFYHATWTADMVLGEAVVQRFIDRNSRHNDDYALPPFRNASLHPYLQRPPASDAGKSITPPEIDQSADAVIVREFANTIITAVDCGICGCRVTIDKEKMMKLFASSVVKPGCQEVDFLLKCSACAGRTCPGCSIAVTSSGMSYGSTARNTVHITWHCDRGRLALIWFLLCGYDHAVAENENQTVSNPRPKKTSTDDELTKRPRSKEKQKNVSGIGYSSEGGHVDYDSDMENVILSEEPVAPILGWGHLASMDTLEQSLPTVRHKRPSKRSQPSSIDRYDSLTTYILCLISAALPSAIDQLPATKFDFEPPHVLASILRRSSILDKSAELLRNDSLDNASQRYWLYDSLIAFTSTLNKGGQMMASILHELRQINKFGHNLVKVSFDEPTRMTDEGVSMAQSLASCIENLACQSERMMKVMQGCTGGLGSEEEQQTLLLCSMISDCATSISANSRMLPPAAPVAGIQQKGDGNWQKGLVILPVPDDTILQHHYHAQEANALHKVTNPPRHRVAHIVKEIVTLETSLPPGIFVRYGETRVDVMKIIIIGPGGTPYESGMFEFDLFCPLEYPNVAPMMQLKTTGGGTVGFNPNLYPDGKVCLSLLGTWQGERWEPGKSTLLQVLVSIQAMIFNDEPWCNEPGRESQRGTEQSKAHSRSLYAPVVKFAMIEWLENKRSMAGALRKGGRTLGESPNTSTHVDEEEGIWADVAKKHFAATGEEIIKTVCNWVNDKPPPHPARARKGKGKLMSSSLAGPGYNTPFSGPGRTIADGEEKPMPSPTSPFGPSKLEQYENLTTKLKEVVKELQRNSSSYDGFYDDELEDQWDD